MISIDLLRNKNNQLVKFTMKGHAGYAQKGADIVCAAVTTAALTAVNGLTDVACISMAPQVAEGYLDCTLPKVLTEQERHDADLILESMVLTFYNLTEQYAAYISIRETVN